MLLMEQLPPRAWDPSSKRDVCFQDTTGPHTGDVGRLKETLRRHLAPWVLAPVPGSLILK